VKQRLLLFLCVATLAGLTVRRFAVRHFQRVGRVATNVERLADADPRVRALAARELAEIGPPARRATPALLTALMERQKVGADYSARQDIAQALVQIGPAAVPALLEAFRDESNRARVWGITPLGREMLRGVSEQSRPPLFAAMQKMRERNDRESKSVGSALAELAQHDYLLLRRWAGHTPSSHSGWSETVTPQWVGRLVSKLETERGLGRAWAANSIGFACSHASRYPIRRFAEETLPALGEALGDCDPAVRFFSSYAVVRIVELGEVEGAEAVPGLVVAIRNIDSFPTYFSRLNLFMSLRFIGPDAAAAVPALVEILEGGENEVNPKTGIDNRRGAAHALGGIGHRDGVPSLTRALGDPNVGIRGAAVEALGEIGPDASAAIPEIVKLLDDAEGRTIRGDGVKLTVGGRAAEALRKIDPEAAREAGVE
jgi:HEAT repeat protein